MPICLVVLLLWLFWYVPGSAASSCVYQDVLGDISSALSMLDAVEKRLLGVEEKLRFSFMQKKEEDIEDNIDFVPIPSKKPSSTDLVILDLEDSGNEEEESYKYSLSLLKMQKLDEASLQLENLIESFPNGKTRGLAYYLLGDISYTKGEFKQASIYFLKSYKIENNGPKTPQVLLKLVRSLKNIEQYDHACAIMKKIEKDFANNVEIKSEIAQEKKSLSGLCV